MSLKRLFFVLLIIVGIISYGAYNYINSGSVIGKMGYEEVKLVDLLSFSKVYDGKNICTRGFYYQTDSVSVIKTGLQDTLYTGSSWVVNESEKDQLLLDFNPERGRVVEAKICGKFESKIDGQFGQNGAWKHQLKARTLGELGESFRFRY